MKFKLIQKIKETSDVTTFVFEPDQPLEWTAGQYMHYILPHENPDDRGTERYFTISSAPFEKHPQITTRHADEKSSTFKTTLFNLEVGDEMEANDLEGDFIFGDPDKEYVFLAGGIGITPFHSILKDLDHKGLQPKITLIYSNRNQEVVFKDEFESFKQRNPNLIIHYLYSPERIDEDSIKKYSPSLQGPIFYMSGPEPMIEALGETLKGMGVAESSIVQDFFPGYPVE